ncbi:MAG TPA: hypothetical protein VHW23_41010 [Kofleriaceae bacterium]|nr:hypothetical protein [Kofleriaceae bacterium]
MRNFVWMWMIMLASARVALAQPADPGTAAQDPTLHTGFVVIDQADASDAAGLQLSYFNLNTSSPDAPTLFRAAAHARFVDPATGLGAYVRLPFAFATGTGNTSSVTDLGDLEVGGIFAPRPGDSPVGVILRAGVTLPTGEKGEAGAIGTVANLLALPDLYNSLPGATTLKFGVSPVLRSGPVFARLDLGLDWNVDADNATIGKALHFNVGVGADVGPGSIMLESENATLFSDSVAGGSASDSVTVDAFAVSGRLNAGRASPYLAWVFPVDKDLRDIFGFMVTAGIELRP